MNQFSYKLEKDFLMVYFLYFSTVIMNVWCVYGGALMHMALAQELFSSIKECVSRVQVELGDESKYLISRVGTIPF